VRISLKSSFHYSAKLIRGRRIRRKNGKRRKVSLGYEIGNEVDDELLPEHDQFERDQQLPYSKDRPDWVHRRDRSIHK
jgi:hypothetical protein